MRLKVRPIKYTTDQILKIKIKYIKYTASNQILKMRYITDKFLKTTEKFN